MHRVNVFRMMHRLHKSPSVSMKFIFSPVFIISHIPLLQKMPVASRVILI